ncbi:hypothetical protein E3N88_13538 [Mikania micrantha]|uniref:Uncharacterized protein n=1 Tax=Mikania micrantha TaxID=192012 RepID=A0A5N6PA06_9ASTR|nr:hypothetical protein E3N88_13538 [Mikania micrantha]
MSLYKYDTKWYNSIKITQKLVGHLNPPYHHLVDLVVVVETILPMADVEEQEAEEEHNLLPVLLVAPTPYIAYPTIYATNPKIYVAILAMDGAGALMIQWIKRWIPGGDDACSEDGGKHENKSTSEHEKNATQPPPFMDLETHIDQII